MGDEHDYWGVTCGACGKTSFGPLNDQGVAECVWCGHMQRFPSKVLESNHGKEENTCPIDRVEEKVRRIEDQFIEESNPAKGDWIAESFQRWKEDRTEAKADGGDTEADL